MNCLPFASLPIGASMHELTGALIKQSDEGFTPGPTGSCSTSWQSQLTNFTNRFNTLNTNATSGESPNLSSIKDQYVTLHDDIAKTLECNVQNSDLSGGLTQTGSLQIHIKKLEKRKKELQVEVDTALARDELLRSRDVKMTTHSLFLLDRPVRKGMIPYLWVISVFFIGIGLVLYKTMLPSIAPDMSTVIGIEMALTDILFNKTVLISLLVCIVIIIIVVSLKVGGVIGK
jgi:hypothetical protein